jgi:hypothetical protein
MDGMIRALAKKRTLKGRLVLCCEYVPQKMTKYNTEVTPTTGMLLVSGHILNPSWNLRLFRNWDKRMDITPDEKISYTTQYQEAFLKNVENEYCPKY